MRVSLKSGDKFGRLTAVASVQNDNDIFATHWLFQCDCGKQKVIRANTVTWEKGVRSCGCLQLESAKKNFVTHGGSYTSTYRTWKKMNARCNNKNDKHYANYGGRGIKIDWKSFEEFLKDMGERKEGMSIDRIDGDGDYNKENCKWSTRSEQQNNRKTCRYIEIAGVTKTLTEWSRVYDVKIATIYYRIKNGMTEAEAITANKRINQFK